ncbi:MmgE/PrpD family protein [Bradyrhizobium sp. Ai1a-2]|uniref:MmgE/PrpD family protein n=1 Tax=Bradyrhizobium sp. Ai1a-2 TaxID=196490 RepID=UPI0006887201|nr:MmgE/PrpD family protein [Bradyrhizobium sp. Ai1a-2]
MSFHYAGPAQPPTDPNGPTGKLAVWLAGFQLEQAPYDARERAKDLILDGLGCAIVGARLPWSRIAVEAVSRFEGSGNAPVIGWDLSLAPPAAALLNGTLIQGFELDDFHPLAPLHSASLVLPALLALLPSLGRVSGKEFLTAALAGFEVGPRVGMALHGSEMLSRGWHSGPVFGTHAAAAAAGTLLKLDAARFEDALGLAGTQSGGLMAAQYEAMCKRMHHGFASRAGLTAALLAASGYTGIKRVFERDYGGFLSVFGEAHNPDASQIARGLGKNWEVLVIAIKPYAAMGALHGPLDAIFEIAARRPLHADEIERIEVGMSHVGYHHGWWEPERPLTPIGAQMHVGYALAAAIADGAAMIRQFAPGRINQDDVWKLIPRIRAYHEPSFDRDKFKRASTHLTVTFVDGSQERAEVAIPKTIMAPLTRQGVVAKFDTLTDGILPRDRRDRIVETVLAIETMDDLSELVTALAGDVGDAFALSNGPAFPQ